MGSIIKTDIFFFVSAIATVMLTVLISILLFYLIRAGKILYKIAKALEGGFKESEEFVNELKERLENNFIFRLFFSPVRKRAKAKLKKNKTNKSRRK
ncbi:MAG: hypothetical protein Q8N55_01625 [bacterium]|nr:hypothetical protein [bacterium]